MVPIVNKNMADESESDGEVAAADFHEDAESEEDVDMEEEEDEVGDDSDSNEDKKRKEAVDRMSKIEKEFADLKDRLYQDQLSAISREIEQIKSGAHTELLQQIELLEQRRNDRIRIAELYRKYQLENINNQISSEKKEAENEYQMRKEEVADMLLQSVLDKKRKIEEDRNNNDLTTDFVIETRTQGVKRNLRNRKGEPAQPEKRRKVQAVVGPSLVYALKESEVLEDIALIRKGKPLFTKRSVKAVKEQPQQQQQSPAPPQQQQPREDVGEETVNVYYDDGKLMYEKVIYERAILYTLNNKAKCGTVVLSQLLTMARFGLGVLMVARQSSTSLSCVSAST
eukprot:Colp12_sorted_trinity150504_noHs@20755